MLVGFITNKELGVFSKISAFKFQALPLFYGIINYKALWI